MTIREAIFKENIRNLRQTIENLDAFLLPKFFFLDRTNLGAVNSFIRRNSQYTSPASFAFFLTASFVQLTTTPEVTQLDLFASVARPNIPLASKGPSDAALSLLWASPLKFLRSHRGVPGLQPRPCLVS